ncbi:MAG: protein kinase [Polyangiales bacterium]
MARDKPNTQATLMLAAKAAAEVSPTAGTMLDVLQSRAFSYYAEGLRQYLTIRLGDAAEGLLAFARVRDRAAGLSDEELTEEPGIRARLYRFARDESKAASKKSGRGLAWYRPRNPEAKHQTAVARIRSDAKEKELLELRYARDLTEREIAFVVEMDEAVVAERLAAAYENAQVLHGSGGNSLPKALLEAFALEELDADFAAAKDGEADVGSQERSRRAATRASGSARDGAEGDDADRTKLGTVLGERYQLKKHIGAGGFADVYRAEDVEVPGHVLALKVLKRPSTSADNRQAALKELRIIAAVYHPSIVQFKDYGWFEERLWFAMPWYEGDVLENRLEEGGLERGEAKGIFVPLARALATLHAASIRHQDIKPDNIFLATLRGFEGGDHGVLPVLLDLGVAAKDAELVLAGTPTYFAPEVAAQFAYREGDPFPSRPIGPASDVFALALSLRNALEPETQPDVAAGAVDAFIRERAGDEIPLFTRPDLRYLNKPLQRWLAPDPGDRPSADELADELAVLSRPEETRARRLGYLKLFGPILAALALLFGVAFYELRQHNLEDRAKAELAQQEADAARRDLEDEETRSEELEEQVGEAEAEIAEQHLSKTELEQELASARGRLRVETRRLAAARRQTEEQEKAVEAAERLTATTAERLRVAEQRSAEIQGDLQTREQEVANVRRELATARSAQSAAEGNLQSARRDLTAAQESLAEETRRAQAAATRATEAQQNLTRANEELRQARARITQLERDLAAARQGAPTQTNMQTVPTVTIPNDSTMRVRRPR